MAGIELNHIPYRASGPAVLDLAERRIDITFGVLGTSLSAIRDGKIRALAVTTEKRVASVPDVPTMAEAGLPGFEASLWFAVVAPALAARAALAAGDVRRHHDAIAGARARHVRADVGDDADELVAEHDARVGRVPRRVAQDLQVGAADAARLDVEHDVPGRSDARQRPLENLEPPRAREDCGPHRRRQCRRACPVPARHVPMSRRPDSGARRPR